MAVGLHASITMAQLSIAIFILGICLARLVFGPMSDAFGRKGPVIVGCFICVIGGVVCILSQDIYLLIVGRFLQGIGSGGANLIARVLLRDKVEGPRLAEISSYYSMANVGLISLAPLAGGYIQHFFGWRGSFVSLAGLALIALIVSIFILPETNVHRHRDYIKPRVLKTSLHSLFSNRLFLIYGIFLFLAYGSILAWVTAAPVLLQNHLGFSPIQFGWIAALVSICYFFGAFTNGRFVKRAGITRMLLIGSSLILFSGSAMIVSVALHYVNAVAFILPVMITLFGLAFIMPNIFAAGLTPFPKIAGIAAAILGSIQIFGGFVSSTLMSIFHDKNQLPVGLYFFVAGIICLLLWWKRQRIRESMREVR